MKPTTLSRLPQYWPRSRSISPFLPSHEDPHPLRLPNFHFGILWVSSSMSSSATAFSSDGSYQQYVPPPVTVKFTAHKSLNQPKTFQLESPADRLQFLEPVISFVTPTMKENYEAITQRILGMDTGRFKDTPFSDFLPTQPVPAIKGYNPKAAIAYAHQDNKYFIECLHDDKRDHRFGPSEVCNSDFLAPLKSWTHNLTLVHESLVGIMSAWSSFAETKSVTWWIAHGEMLGWFWNSKFLPWDIDLDIQMSTYQLIQLIDFNNTLLEGRYLLDVNPNVVVRSMQQMNIIDARLIDIKTGYFMDITGLTQTKSNMGIVYCKTPHMYSYDDLMPLHETVLEGIKVWRPRAAMKLLRGEYGERSMTLEAYRPHGDTTYRFERESNEWTLYHP
ncbi:UNVERIFIED_CONTAM: hypothetical protein HDU68_004875 [Siphonaria sp. JEL0065]|nr:hypothetical protein HDU68_004875 [Siphonaria sp. JEL0065]